MATRCSRPCAGQVGLQRASEVDLRTGAETGVRRAESVRRPDLLSSPVSVLRPTSPSTSITRCSWPCSAPFNPPRSSELDLIHSIRINSRPRKLKRNRQLATPAWPCAAGEQRSRATTALPPPLVVAALGRCCCDARSQQQKKAGGALH